MVNRQIPVTNQLGDTEGSSFFIPLNVCSVRNFPQKLYFKTFWVPVPVFRSMRTSLTIPGEKILNSFKLKK